MFDDWLFGEKTTKGFDGSLQEGKRTDTRIKVCTKCNLCWELDKYHTKQHHNVRKNLKVYCYYEDFPTYGKVKEICPRCKTT